MPSSVVNIRFVMTFSQINCTLCVTFIDTYDLQITFKLKVTLTRAEIRLRSLGVKLGRTDLMQMNVTYNDLQVTHNDLQKTLRLKVTLVSR